MELATTVKKPGASITNPYPSNKQFHDSISLLSIRGELTREKQQTERLPTAGARDSADENTIAER